MSIVLEFIGLPGAGKSTIAAEVTASLLRQGVEPLTAKDFVAWLGGISRMAKLKMLLSDIPYMVRQFWGAARFALSVRPRGFQLVRRFLLMLFVNHCFDYYVDANQGRVIVMDQANMQLLWSVGAYAEVWRALALEEVCRSMRGKAPRLFAFVAASPEVVAERIRRRTSHASRFDRESTSVLKGALSASTRLMDDIVTNLGRNGELVVVLDAAAPVAVNTQALIEAVWESLA